MGKSSVLPIGNVYNRNENPHYTPWHRWFLAVLSSSQLVEENVKNRLYGSLVYVNVVLGGLVETMYHMPAVGRVEQVLLYLGIAHVAVFLSIPIFLGNAVEFARFRYHGVSIASSFGLTGYYMYLLPTMFEEGVDDLLLHLTICCCVGWVGILLCLLLDLGLVASVEKNGDNLRSPFFDHRREVFLDHVYDFSCKLLRDNRPAPSCRPYALNTMEYCHCGFSFPLTASTCASSGSTAPLRPPSTIPGSNLGSPSTTASTNTEHTNGPEAPGAVPPTPNIDGTCATFFVARVVAHLRSAHGVTDTQFLQYSLGDLLRCPVECVEGVGGLASVDGVPPRMKLPDAAWAGQRSKPASVCESESGCGRENDRGVDNSEKVWSGKGAGKMGSAGLRDFEPPCGCIPSLRPQTKDEESSCGDRCTMSSQDHRGPESQPSASSTDVLNVPSEEILAASLCVSRVTSNAKTVSSGEDPSATLVERASSFFRPQPCVPPANYVFYYPMKVISAFFVSLVALVLAAAFVDDMYAAGLEWCESSEFVITYDLEVCTTVQASMIGGIVCGVAYSILTPYLFVLAFRKKSAELQAGGSSFVFRREKLSFSKSSRLVGTVVSFTLTNFVVMYLVGAITVFLLAWDLFWDFMWEIRDYLIAYGVYYCIKLFVNDYLVDRVLTDGHDTRAPRALQFFIPVLEVFNVFGGATAGLMRVVWVFLYALVSLLRIDAQVLPLGLETLDSGYASFMGSVLHNERISHPALYVFARLLSTKEFLPGGVTPVPFSYLPEASSGDSGGKMKFEDSSKECSEKENSRKRRARRLRVRNRLWLAYVLTLNPALLPYRVRPWQWEAHIAAAENERKAEEELRNIQKFSQCIPRS